MLGAATGMTGWGSSRTLITWNSGPVEARPPPIDGSTEPEPLDAEPGQRALPPPGRPHAPRTPAHGRLVVRAARGRQSSRRSTGVCRAATLTKIARRIVASAAANAHPPLRANPAGQREQPFFLFMRRRLGDIGRGCREHQPAADIPNKESWRSMLTEPTKTKGRAIILRSHVFSKANQRPNAQQATALMDDVEARNKDTSPSRGKLARLLLVALNCGMLALGTTAGPLLTRLYYDKGGSREWLSAWLESAGWPLLLLPVAASYASRRARHGRGAPLLLTPPRVLLAAAGLGVATGADNFVYAYSLRYLPVSTSAILISTQLAFTVLFAFLLVRQRLTAPTVNAVALLTAGAAMLGLHVSGDRPGGVSRAQYWMGFALTLGAAVLYGLILPLVELAYKRAGAAAGGGRAVTYALVMEMQLVMGFFATVFCTIGMVVNKDFQVPGLFVNGRRRLAVWAFSDTRDRVRGLTGVEKKESPTHQRRDPAVTVSNQHARAAAGERILSVVAHSTIPILDPLAFKRARANTIGMDLEARNNSPPPARSSKTKTTHRLMVALNCALLGVGVTGGQLLSRLYYSKGGHRQWLSAWLQTGAWPLLLIPLAISYSTRRARDGRGAPLLLSPPRVLLAAAGLGLSTGVDDFLYAWGLEFLPVSTSAILISTQLAFTVLFAFLVVGQRLTPATMNAVALLTVGAVVLGLHVSGDRPEGVTRGQYWMGFVLTLGAAVLYGLILPLVELAYNRAAAAGGGGALTYAVAMELQLVMGFVATVFCTVGMVVNKDFQVRPHPHVSPCAYVYVPLLPLGVAIAPQAPVVSFLLDNVTDTVMPASSLRSGRSPAPARFGVWGSAASPATHGSLSWLLIESARPGGGSRSQFAKESCKELNQQGYAYGVDDFIYAYGLPTNSRVHLRDPHLEFSTHLVFTVCFAFLIVGHRQTPATVNAVALLTADAVVLGHPRGAVRTDH
ncbi:hypothetical protein HU200_037805 [Digitaria exilis]|uniref:Uncharacterized protein n=1 Tax=Digitaria exilis TaxID=1010633 RepID=A0A835EKS7_9POAL|nr:hypothetical protein HU200_037805 [Digitaria exilis]